MTSAPVPRLAVSHVDNSDEELPNSVISKVQLLLSAFQAGPLQMRLTELSRRSGVNKASTYRLAQELVRWGLLERVDDRYQLGFRIFELGQRVPLVAVLRGVSRPYLIDLFADTRAGIHMALLDGECVVYVEKIIGSVNNLPHSDVGRHFPASCTSSGKLLLAMHPDAQVALDHLAQSDLPRSTSLSVDSWDRLREQLGEVRRRGYAVEYQEAASGFGSVAVPVTRADGSVYAAISAAQPLSQFNADRILAPLRVTAHGVSRAVEDWLLDRPTIAVR